MRPIRALRLATVLLLPLLGLSAAPATAQSFFEELFGIGRAAKPPVPPRGLPPGAPPAGPVPPGGSGSPGDPPSEAPKPAAPAPLRPVVLKVPAEDNVVGQELMLNGLGGSLKLDKGASGIVARITVPGTKVSQPSESCKVPLGGGGPVALTAEGRPDGVARFEAASAECPIRFDILEGSVLVTSLGGNPVCTIAATDCATTPAGLWGPPAATLLPRAGEFDSARGVADKAVRENYKVMTQRARGQDIRPIVTEQAAFSSDREQVCRAYAREGTHGFCNLRFTEARALALAARLGMSGAAPTAAAAPPRVRRKPAVEGLNPDTAGGNPFGE